MANTPIYVPFRKGDIITDDNGRAKKYAGPIFELRLPEGADPIVAKMPFKLLGYKTKIDDQKRTLFVFGDLPDEEIAGQREGGVEVILTKERGEVIPCPWRDNNRKE